MLSILIALACTKGDPTDSGTTDSGDVAVDADEDGFDETVDCDDSDAAVNPDATEVCDGLDNDCDDLVDDADDSLDASTGVSFYVDADGDTYGAGDAQWSCESAGVDNADDCDDAVAQVNPGAAEVCNDVDDDCDGLVDDDDDSVSADTTWHPDDDTDCDDALSAVNPGGPRSATAWTTTVTPAPPRTAWPASTTAARSPTTRRPWRRATPRPLRTWCSARPARSRCATAPTT
ncbi:MAG: hypothetical protein GY884_34660 [Proteobacteria bacterium]|nr:hypothetical protein [Pseudomonadota bacterium]